MMNEGIPHIDDLNCRVATLETWLEASTAREKALEETVSDHKKVIEVWRKDLDRYSSEMAILTKQIEGLTLVNRSQADTISIQFKELNKVRGLFERREKLLRELSDTIVQLIDERNGIEATWKLERQKLEEKAGF